MKCINCEAEWKTKDSETTTVIKCPFCGENPLLRKQEVKHFETSREALVAINKQFGTDVLLGKLKAYLLDFAPSLNENIKNLIYTVQTTGASKALKESINGSQEDKERAVKIAIRKMIEAFVTSEMAENIVYEFTDALGWKIDKIKTITKEEKVNKEKPISNLKTKTVKTTEVKKTIVEKPKKLKEVIELLISAQEDDYKKAIVILNEFSEQENAKAQYLLGNCYEYGKGVIKDESKCIEYYLKSAKQGFSDAQFTIGEYYQYGKYVNEDIDKAVEWYKKAYDQGDVYAKIALKNLNKL